MTELAALLMALMLTDELGLAIALGGRLVASGTAARRKRPARIFTLKKTPTTGGVAGVCRQIRHGRPIRTPALHFSS